MAEPKGLPAPTGAAVRQAVDDALAVPEATAQPLLYGPDGAVLRELFRPGGWFSPGEPQRTIAPAGTPPRQFQYPLSVNRFVQPRATEPIGFAELRAMSRRATLVRLAIETCKDIPEAYGWQVVPKPGRKVKDNDSRIDEVQSFFERPDQIHTFHRWCRMWREDYLGLDAPAILVRRTRGGRGIAKEPFALEVISGDTIKPLIDATGRRPPVGPAYEQVIYGIKAAEFTAQDLLYMPRNPMPDRLYGYPPTEQLIMIAASVMARELRGLLYNADGNVPDIFVRVPKDYTPDQIARTQLWFDQRKGDLAARTGVMVVPESGIDQMREPPGKTEQDEWWARYVCWGYSLSPLVFLRQGMNRACHSDDTEVLTEQGWQSFPTAANTNARIASYSPTTGMLEYHQAVKHYVYPYRGPMVRYLTKGVDVLVTPEHEMWAARKQGGAYEKFPAARPPVEQLRFRASAHFDAQEQTTFTLPALVSESKFAWPREWAALPMPMDDWLEFLGYYLSEGGLSHADKHYLLTLAQNPGATADRIQACLERLPISFTRYPLQKSGIVRWNVYGRQVHNWLLEHAGGYCHDKRIPREFLSLGVRQLRILFDALMAGDGSWDTREGCRSGYYATTSAGLADDVQELAFKLGYCAALCPVHQDKRPNRQPLHRVVIAEREEHAVRTETYVTPDGAVVMPGALHPDVPYEGNVYCVEVPNHLFVTRRNGKIAIHGNTGKVLQDTALDEGLIPRQNYESELLAALIQMAWGWDDLTINWTEARDSDPQTQATIAQIHVSQGIKTRNEARDDLGLDPIEGGDIATVTVGAQLIVLADLAAGKYTPLSPEEQAQQKTEAAAAAAQALAAGNGNGGAPAAAPAKESPAKGEEPAKEAKPVEAKGEQPAALKKAVRTIDTVPKSQRRFWQAERGMLPQRARPSDDSRGAS